MPTLLETKPFKSFEDQLDILMSRGLLVSDRKKSVETLKHINYYRLSAYSLTLRHDDRFYPKTTIENIIELYNFDDAFRHLIFIYTTVIENSFRTYTAYHHSQKYGPLGYLNNQNFENEWFHSTFLSELNRCINRSDDVFIKHHLKDLKGVFPFWVAIEVTTFGMVSKLYKNFLNEDKDLIAKTYFSVSREYIENWLHCAAIARNISAHGARFYNRKLEFCKVKISSKMQVQVNPSSPFAFVFAIYNLLPSDEIKNTMIVDLKTVFTRYPFALPQHMGFPSNWELILKQRPLIGEKKPAGN